MDRFTRTYSQIAGGIFVFNTTFSINNHQTLSASGDSRDLESRGKKNIVSGRERSNPCPPADHTKPRSPIL